MSIADFYISNGIDPWDHRQFENWIVGTKLEFRQQSRPRRRLRSAPYTESSLNDYLICDIAEKEEWNKIERTADERDENEDVPRDRKLSFRKGKYEVEFFLDRRSVTSREIVNVNVNHTATPSITTTQRIRVNRSIVMKYVPNILEDPTNHNFDTGTRNVIGVIHTWKGSYGFVRTFHHTQYGQGGGVTHGYQKNEYFVHQSKLSSELLAQKNSYKFLGLTPVIFDTVPTDEKLDRAVNVQLWTGSYHGHPNSDPSCSSPLYVHNNNSNSVVTPSPGGGRKRRKLSRFSWTEDELLTDRDQAEKEIKRDRREEVERFHENCCVTEEDMVDYLLRGKLNDEYEAYAWIDDESWLIIDQEEAEEEMDQEEADEEERFNDDLLNNLVWGKLSDDYDEPSWMDDEDGLIIDREIAEEEIYHQEVVDEEERFYEDLLNNSVVGKLSDDYDELSWMDDENGLIIDREIAEDEMNQEKDDEEERVHEGLVDYLLSEIVLYDDLFPWYKQELLIDQEEIKDDMHQEAMEEERRVDIDTIELLQQESYSMDQENILQNDVDRFYNNDHGSNHRRNKETDMMIGFIVNVRTADTYQQQQQQQQVTATTQSSDSAWQVYHAAQALATNQHQQQQQATAAAAVKQQQQQPPSDMYNEQFHRYAYYYGENSAREYYGLWSPPIGTLNPYGTNPAGITYPPPTATRASD